MNTRPNLRLPLSPGRLGPLLLMPLLVMAMLTLSACSSPSAPVTKTAATLSGSLSDGEILQVLRNLNNGEILQAEMAMQRSTNRAVQDTAELIRRDHMQANDRIDNIARSGIELDKSPLSRGLDRQVNNVYEELVELSGTEFDCRYLQKQVEQHELALETVRSDLQPDAEDQQVKDLLSTAESGLQRHLEQARSAREEVPDCNEG